MDIGNKIVCINNMSRLGDNKFVNVTIDKVYTSIDKDNVSISIINDLGNRRGFSRSRFILLSEYRKNTINEILDL